MIQDAIKLTQYSHGAGCGCKISPSVLDSILAAAGKSIESHPGLLVGNEAVSYTHLTLPTSDLV